MKEPAIGFHEMIERAEAGVPTLSAAEVRARMADDVLLVDIRDVRELERDGHIPGSKHVPRGMLEFWMHPESPYFKDYFDTEREVVLMCNRGWRSAVAARNLQDIGISVSHMGEGFGGWQEQGFDIAPYQRRPSQNNN